MRRTFHFLAHETDDGELLAYDREEAREALLDLESSLHRLGGVLSVSAVRRQIGDDEYITIGVAMVYESFSPAHKIEPEAVQDGAAEPVS